MASILELIVGAINEKEDYTSVEINCEDKGGSGKSLFPPKALEVLFPDQGSENIVPLNGGSVVKIQLGRDIDPESYAGVTSKISSKLTGIGSLTNFVSNKSTLAESGSSLAELYVKINSFLEKTGFFQKSLRSLGVPTLALSSVISEDIVDFEDLESEIERTRLLGVRSNELSVIGSFKFIPFETIKQIYKIAKEGYGYNVSISGNTFFEIAEKLDSNPEDEDISKAILNIFPILRIDDDFIFGDDIQQLIGYYTIYKDSIYVKTPDLSARDSSGYSINPYDIGVDNVQDYVNFAFEMITSETITSSGYDAIAFDYLAPPSIEVLDQDYEFPAIKENGSISVEISASGAVDGASYYLSPIDKATTAKIQGVKNVRKVSDAVEFFTAPNLAVPYYSDSEGLKPVFVMDDSFTSDDFGTKINYSYTNDDIKKLGDQIIVSLASSNIFVSSTETDIDNYEIEINKETIGLSQLGVPLFVSEGTIGVTSSQYCGIANRPDIFLGSREEDASYRRNDRKYLSDKIYASKEFFMSLTPNIAREEQIPKLWIKAKGGPSNADSNGRRFIEFGEAQNGFLALDDFGSPNGNTDVEFALYAVDKLGQISRAYGPNIVVTKNEVLTLGVSPDGFKDDGVIIQVGSAMPTLTIELEESTKFESLVAWSQKSGGIKLFEINPSEVDIVNTSSGFTISFNGISVEEVVGTANGVVWLEINGSENRIQLFIADPDVTSIDQLPGPLTEKVEFIDPNGLKAKRFGKTIDSIPILLDGSNAEITLKYKKKIFKQGSEIYAYFAFCKNKDEENYKILSEDVSPLTGTSGGICEVFLDGLGYWVPTNIEYKFGSSYFSRISNKKALLKFPGPAGNINISRFGRFTGNSLQSPACIILTNSKLSPAQDGSFISLISADNEYAKISIGSNTSVGEEDRKPAFINPPHILGMVAGIPDSDQFASSSKVMGDYFQDIRGVSNAAQISNEDVVGPIITSDRLDRLALIFTGSNNERRVSKAYTAYIGSTRVRRRQRAGKIKRISSDENLLLMNLKKIKDVRDVGWTNIRIEKEDKRFNVNYDSTVYNVSTVKFSCTGENPDPNCSEDEADPGITKTEGSGKNAISVLRKENKFILANDGENKLICSESANIFPDVNNGGLSPLPYYPQFDGTRSFSLGSCSGGGLQIFDKGSSYAYFRNPIKIFPDTDLLLNLFLTDTDTVNNPSGEMTTVRKNGSITVSNNLDELKETYNKISGQADEANAKLDEASAKLEEESQNRDPDGLSRTEEEINQDKEDIQKSKEIYTESDESAQEGISAVEKAEAEEAAAQQVRDSLDPNSPEDIVASADAALKDAQDAANKALNAANEAVDGLNNALNVLENLNDELSRKLMIANGLINEAEDALTVSRSDSFYGVRIADMAISKTAAISTGNIDSSNKNEIWLNIKTRFDQTAAIKFNSPEILSITTDGKDFLPGKFSEIKLGDGRNILLLTTVGTDRNTKLEINKIRTDFTIQNELGILKDLSVIIESKNEFLLSGSKPCLEIALTNSNQERLLLSNLDNNLAIDLQSTYERFLIGGDRVKKGVPSTLKDTLADNPLKFINVSLEKANIPKEFMQSFCDMSFHLTAELSLQLRNFRVLLVPIKVILCIVDVICALLHPIRLAFAIIRLFLCLYDLILLLPQLSVPAMLINLLLHILELLLCVIVKMLSIVNAINEIISAFDVAIRDKNYPAIIALEETLNEHLASLEADLEVLEPILTILGLFLELLQLVFAFPCQVGSDEDAPSCIDPSMIAGIILSKVAPSGRIEPDALLPMAQTYTTLDPADGTNGNTPSSDNDNDEDRFGRVDVLKEAKENVGATVVPDNSGYGGRELTGLTDSLTGEPKVIGEGGFFSGDNDEDGRHDNVDYTTLRFDEGGDNFQATFGVSFTKSIKKFNLFTGPDPRLVTFQFNERGLTNPLAFNWFLAAFFRKKNIDLFQTLDSPPGFVIPDGNSLIVNSDQVGFTSPVDGSSDFTNGGFTGFYLEERAGGTYQPKLLTATIEVEVRGVDENGQETVEIVEETQDIGQIPMIALVDDEFNVYYVEEGDGGTGGIIVEDIDGVQCITSISAKMINYPTAPKKKFSREDREVYRSAEELKPKSVRGEELKDGKTLTGPRDDPAVPTPPIPVVVGGPGDIDLGQILVYEQANANWLSGEFDPDEGLEYGSEFFTSEADGQIFKPTKFNKDFGSFTAQYIQEEMAEGRSVKGVLIDNISAPPFPEYGVYDWANGSKKEQNDFGDSIDSIKVFDFPTLHFVDMRHLKDDILAACFGRPDSLLLDNDVFTDEGIGDLEDLIEETQDCVQSFLDFFLSDKEVSPGTPEGVVPRIRAQLEQGIVPEPVVVDNVISKYNETRECIQDKVDRACKFVLNPLNTSFKLLNDIDESPLTNYINPEQEDLANLINYDLVDELELDSELQGFPKITGAMEYASGIGDSAAVRVGEKAVIRIIPRDCYDDTLPSNLDLTDSIKIQILEDGTGGAALVAPGEGPELFVKNEGEYTAAISSDSPGVVKIKATVCSVTVQAVTDQSIRSSVSSAEVDCVDDDGVDPDDVGSFAPGALTKVDRILTILFTSAPVTMAAEGDAGRLATPRDQVFGTNLEN